MATTATKVERKVGKAVSAFQKARDALAAAEAKAEAEAAALAEKVQETQAVADEEVVRIRLIEDQKVADLTAQRQAVEATKAQAASIRAKLDEFLTP